MTASLLSITLVLIGSFFSAVGALFVKKGMDKFEFTTLFKNWALLSGIIIYGATVILYIIALRGGELSLLFPLASTTYLWSSLFAVKFLQEEMNPWKWFSAIGIIIGVIFMGLGS